MNLQENIHRIKQVMGLKEINLGPSKYTPEYLEQIREKYPNVHNAIYRRKLYLEPYNYLDYFTRMKRTPVDDTMKKVKV